QRDPAQCRAVNSPGELLLTKRAPSIGSARRQGNRSSARFNIVDSQTISASSASVSQRVEYCQPPAATVPKPNYKGQKESGAQRAIGIGSLNLTTRSSG